MIHTQHIERKLAVGILIGVLICASIFLWVRYKLSHMPFDFPSNSDAKIQNAIKGTATLALVLKQPSNTASTVTAHYRDVDLQSDARLFDAWRSSVELGDEILQHTENGNWVKSSSGTNFVPPEKRLDPWNHSFCLLRRDDILLIVSAGPQAPASPVCSNIQVERSELASLPAMRLIQTPGGNLVLMVSQKSFTPH